MENIACRPSSPELFVTAYCPTQKKNIRVPQKIYSPPSISKCIPKELSLPTIQEEEEEMGASIGKDNDYFLRS